MKRLLLALVAVALIAGCASPNTTGKLVPAARTAQGHCFNPDGSPCAPGGGPPPTPAPCIVPGTPGC